MSAKVGIIAHQIGVAAWQPLAIGCAPSTCAEFHDRWFTSVRDLYSMPRSGAVCIVADASYLIRRWHLCPVALMVVQPVQDATVPDHRSKSSNEGG